MEHGKSTVTLKDLISVNKDTYRLLHDPKTKPEGIPGFELVRHNFDKTSHHSGIAFYHENSGTVVLGHRGSATVKDWLVTDPQILLGAKQTKADVAAITFAESVLAELDRNRKPISNIIETGHSKGGRESQMVTAHLTQKGIIPCVGLTFNSAMISKEVKLPDIDYDHVNLRIHGGSIFKIDPVSSVGRQLGENVDFPHPEVKSFIHAHSLGSFETGLIHYPEIEAMDVRDLVSNCKQSLTIPEINNHQRTFKHDAWKSETISALPSNIAYRLYEFTELVEDYTQNQNTQGSLTQINNLVQSINLELADLSDHPHYQDIVTILQSDLNNVPELANQLTFGMDKQVAAQELRQSAENAPSPRF